MLILISGISGDLVGVPCAKAALARGHSVRGLGRNPDKLDKSLMEQLEGFVKMEDMYDLPALDRAVAGVDAVICATSAFPMSVVDAQLLLLRAAERAGVKIFHANSWNYDWSGSQLGDHETYDAFLTFWNHARLTSSIKPLYMFTGCIADWMFRKSGRDWDPETKTFRFYGENTTKITYTTSGDLAAYVVEAISAPNAAEGGFVRIESFRASYDDVQKTYNEVRGGKVEANLNRLGSMEDAEAVVQKGRASAQEWWKYIWAAYEWHFERGDWEYESVDCARFPSVKQTSLKQFLEQNPDV